MDDRPGLTALDRVCLIVMAIIFYMAIRYLQDVQSDIQAIARNCDTSVTELHKRIDFIEEQIP